MDRLLPLLQDALAETSGSALGAALVFGAVVLLVLLVAMPVLGLWRGRGSGGGITFRWEAGDPRALGRPSPDEGLSLRPSDEPVIPGRQTWPDRREELPHRLDVAERGVGRFYVGLLCLLMAAATGL